MFCETSALGTFPVGDILCPRERSGRPSGQMNASMFCSALRLAEEAHLRDLHWKMDGCSMGRRYTRNRVWKSAPGMGRSKCGEGP